MKNLHSLLFYALLTPALTLGAGTLLAAQGSSEDTDLGEQSMGQDADPAKQSPEHNKEVIKSKYNTPEPADQKTGTQSAMQDKGYMESVPANGMVASDLIGTELRTSGDESVGEINDLIMDQDGQVVAALVNVGGFLGMGDKHVAIDWKSVKRSGNPADRNLRVDMTREELQSAPSFDRDVR
ncbi:PRC-barrel domain-containing protein [Marinobacter subterrani]|uniref:PRC-barrel domain-containing protein n=1 Tax=Marinobacter subterrani TaxID=1658765 RepID=UPI00235263AB|nr:PRC-barrel domain-containing protein [Marinobacter subterrani]